MALNFTSFNFRFPVGSTSAQGWQNKLAQSIRFLLPNVENRRIRKIGVFCYYQYETTTAAANESIVIPWYQASFFPMSNDGFLRNLPGRVPDPVVVKGVTVPVSISSQPEPIFQITHHNNWMDTDFEGNGITLFGFGYYNPAGAPSTTSQIEVVVTIGWENIC